MDEKDGDFKENASSGRSILNRCKFIVFSPCCLAIVKRPNSCTLSYILEVRKLMGSI